MSQTSLPIAIEGAGWTGAYTDIADESDATYVESPTSPDADEPLLVILDALSPPEALTGHVLTVRVATDPDSAHAEPLSVDIELLDGTDNSVIASKTTVGVGAALQNIVLTLTEQEAASVVYANIKARVTAYHAGI